MRRTLNLVVTLCICMVACAAGLYAGKYTFQEQTTVQTSSIEKLKQELEAGGDIKREAPFAMRKFEPTLGGRWVGNAVAYGCYRKGQAPSQKGPTKEQILEDLTIIKKHWNLIRVYGADDDTERILEVIRDNELPFKVMLGMWLENEPDNPSRRKANIEQVMRGIALTRQYGALVAAVSVGNETQVSWAFHRMYRDDLIRYVRAVRNNISPPVTTADDWGFWITPESKTVADELDFLVTHIHPMWNGQTLTSAIEWTDEIYSNVRNNHSTKTIAIGEIGWATNYDSTKRGEGQQGSLIKGEVSVQAQGQFLAMYNEWVRTTKVTTFFFEAFDESWKGGGENSSPAEVEKHWGVFYENRTPKESFQNSLKESNSR